MLKTRLVRSGFVLIMGICLCAAVFANEPVHRNIDGDWVTFDRLANPGYDEGNAIDVVYYPGTDNPAFNISYQDILIGNGIGFDDPSDGLDRRNCVIAAVNYIAGVLLHETGSADIHFGISELDGTGALASCDGGLAVRLTPENRR